MKREVTRGTRSIITVGRKSRAAVIPKEWFEKLKRMGTSPPKRIRWLLDSVGITIPDDMSDVEAIRHLINLLYQHYPRSFVDRVLSEALKEETLEIEKKSHG
mgnify:CR=1 FL=1